MRKLILGLIVAVMLGTLAAVPTAAKENAGTTIQEGVLVYAPGHYLAGQPLKVGFDIFGYNYQSHLFSGYYANVYLGGDGFPPYEGDTTAYLAAHPTVVSKWYWPWRDDRVDMKWNDAWLSNRDCDGDGKLDRHYGLATYIGSGAWETNHQSGKYLGDDGKMHQWTYFVKIVAAPADAVKTAGVWDNADGTEIGPVIWTEFATIQSIYNDPYGGYHGQEYISPAGPGLGKWD